MRERYLFNEGGTVFLEIPPLKYLYGRHFNNILTNQY